MLNNKPVTAAVNKLVREMLLGCPEAFGRLTELRSPLAGDEGQFVLDHPGLVPVDDGKGGVQLGLIGVLQGLVATEGGKLVFDVVTGSPEKIVNFDLKEV